MSALVWITAVYVVWTKFLDCASTLRHVRTAEAETNAFARRLMRRIGFGRAVWGIFGFVTVWTVAIAASVLATGNRWTALGYAALALLVGTVQLAVARTNSTGRFNVISRAVLRLHVGRAARR